MSSPIREKKRKVFWRSLQVFSKRPAAQRSTMFMGTRNCPGNLTKSPGEEVEGGGGKGVKLHGPASHYPTPGGGVYTRSLKATRTKISSGSTGHLARCTHGFTFNKRYCPPRRLEFKVD